MKSSLGCRDGSLGDAAIGDAGDIYVTGTDLRLFWLPYGATTPEPLIIREGPLPGHVAVSQSGDVYLIDEFGEEAMKIAAPEQG